MSQRNGYLVPDKIFPIGEFGRVIKKILEDQDVIDGYYDQENKWFAAGKQSSEIFVRAQGSIAFEYAEMRDSDRTRLIPEGVGAGLGVQCSRCNSSVDEILIEAVSEFYEREYDTGQVFDMAAIQIGCDNCKHVGKLADLSLPENMLIAPQFIQFVEIDSEFNMVRIAEIEKRIGCKLKVFYE